MIDQEAARRIAERTCDAQVTIDDSRACEINQGWFFPYRSVDEPVFGSQGVIINKQNGKAFFLGSAFPVERDLDLYDRGYQFRRYDLVILEVYDVEATLDAFLRLDLVAIEPAYMYGTVWRIPRRLTREELEERVSVLPCVFGDCHLYFRIEVLEQAKLAGYFRFEALEFRSRDHE